MIKMGFFWNDWRILLSDFKDFYLVLETTKFMSMNFAKNLVTFYQKFGYKFMLFILRIKRIITEH